MTVNIDDPRDTHAAAEIQHKAIRTLPRWIRSSCGIDQQDSTDIDRQHGRQAGLDCDICTEIQTGVRNLHQSRRINLQPHTVRADHEVQIDIQLEQRWTDKNAGRDGT